VRSTIATNRLGIKRGEFGSLLDQLIKDRCLVFFTPEATEIGKVLIIGEDD